ncbi:MAG: GNAT family N-acetyltransferase [Chitinophagales bacterium]|nr:GNAT family N-acetyltransferase [Chitinophagales bacterium]
MKIINKDLTLRQLTIGDIELVRQRRNDRSLSKYFVTRDYITYQHQIEWFKDFDWENGYYWIIEFDGVSKGSFFVNKFDKTNRSLYTNVLIFDERDSGSPQFIRASWLITYLCFERLNIKFLTSKIHKENISAIQNDEYLGFKITGEEENYLLLRCNKESFDKRRVAFRNLFFRKNNSISIIESEEVLFGQRLNDSIFTI